MWFRKTKKNSVTRSVPTHIDVRNNIAEAPKIPFRRASITTRDGDVISIKSRKDNFDIRFKEFIGDKGPEYSLVSTQRYDKKGKTVRLAAESVLIPLIGASGQDYESTLIVLASDYQFHLRIAHVIMDEEWLLSGSSIRTPWTTEEADSLRICINDHSAWSTY
jgi:hypothetical protein